MQEKVRPEISSCLLGERLRCDGGHKLDKYLANTLWKYVDYVEEIHLKAYCNHPEDVKVATQ